MEKLAPKTGKPSARFLRAKRNVKLAGVLGLFLWYAIVVLAVIM